MWESSQPYVVTDQAALPQTGPRRQLTRWDAHAFPAEPGVAVEHDDSNPLAGSEWEEQIVLVRKLSAGAYGFVWCCLDRESGTKIAIKFIARDKSTIDKNVEREIINHSGLMHPHIVEFKICFLTNKYLAIAMEYAEGQNLLRLVNAKQGLSEDEARWLYQQLILAVDYTHRMGVINRDIKLENVLLVNENGHPFLKMCDFGYSINQNHSLPVTAVGTPGYTAPEILRTVRRRYDGKPADVWSTGVVLYAMLFCQYPFDRRNGDPPQHSRDFQRLFIDRLKAADIMLPAHTPISSDCKDLLRNIFHPSPEQRITLQGIQKHPWFEKNLPTQMKNQDWNSQYIQHVDAAERAAIIRQTVHAALSETVILDSDVELDAPALQATYGDGPCCDQGHFQAAAYQTFQY